MKTRLFALAAALTGSLLGACRHTTTPEPQEAPKGSAAERAEETPASVKLSAAAASEAGIATWEVKPVDLERLLVLTGTVGHDENHLLQVAANVRGRVAEIPVDLGASVAAGAPLLVIESVELGKARAEYLTALSSLHVAARTYERAKALVDGKAISLGEFQSREGEYLSRLAAASAAERTLRLYGEAEDEVASLRRSVDSKGGTAAGDGARFTLRAPFAGRVIERKVTPGALFEALQPLLTLADLRTVWVFLQAYEKDLALVRSGLAVTIRTDAYPEKTFHGKIDFVGSVLDSATRSTKVRATVPNPTEALRPGMFVRAVVDIARPAAESKAVTAVPQSSIQTLEGRSIVFVQAGPGVFERRFVELGRSFEGFTEVLSGIKPGEVVVSDGSFVLKSELAKASLGERE